MNVVFDFGGVLFDWRPKHFMARLLPQHTPDAATTDALVRDFFQGYGGDWGEFDRGTVDAEALAALIAARTGLSTDDVLRVVDAVPAELKPIAGTVDLLHRLHAAGHPLYFLSNMPEPYARHLEANHAFIGRFQGGVFSSRVKLIKPEAAIYEHATRTFGIEPAQSLFIDDMAQNVAAARAAGWQAVLFESPSQCEAELRAHGLL